MIAQLAIALGSLCPVASLAAMWALWLRWDREAEESVRTELRRTRRHH